MGQNQSQSQRQELYARVKPYNPKTGHFVQRIFVDFLRRPVEGGTGIGKPIEWVIVDHDQARLLAQYRQVDGDPDSKAVFDIVDEETRLLTDRAEEAARRAGINVVATGKRQAQRVSDARPGARMAQPVMVEPVITTKPDMIPGAEAFLHDPAFHSDTAAADANAPAPTSVGRWGQGYKDPLADRIESPGSASAGLTTAGGEQLQDLAGPEEIPEPAVEPVAPAKPAAAAAAAKRGGRGRK